jgi:NADH-quinone oxidoreductase subunit J
MADKLFYFLAFLSILSALLVVFSRNPVHSVLYLILTFFTITGQYILLNAQFLAVVNIIVYAGAIMVLFLFVIMFLNLRNEAEKQKSTLLQVGAAVAGGSLFLIVIGALRQISTTKPSLETFDSQIGMVQNLGIVLFTDFLLPFELASILLLVSMIGAVLVARREEGETNMF